jgi:hypothetical protein
VCIHALCSRAQVTDENTDSQRLLFNLGHLRSIQITLCHSSSTDSLIHLLSHLSSPRLELVAFRLGYWEHPDDGTRLAWEEVDALLQSSPFDRLREVYFDSNQSLATPATNRIAHHMSQCRGRGILITSESKKRDWKFCGMGADDPSDETFGCRYSFSNHP